MILICLSQWKWTICKPTIGVDTFNLYSIFTHSRATVCSLATRSSMLLTLLERERHVLRNVGGIPRGATVGQSARVQTAGACPSARLVRDTVSARGSN